MISWIEDEMYSFALKLFQYSNGIIDTLQYKIYLIDLLNSYTLKYFNKFSINNHLIN